MTGLAKLSPKWFLENILATLVRAADGYSVPVACPKQNPLDIKPCSAKIRPYSRVGALPFHISPSLQARRAAFARVLLIEKIARYLSTHWR